MNKNILTTSIPGFPNVGVNPNPPNTRTNQSVIVTWGIMAVVLAVLVVFFFFKRNKKL